MNKKKIIMMSALLLVLVAVIIGITYAVYTFTGNSNLNTIDLGRISMSYTEPSNAYVLDNALPMTDEEGKGQNNYFEFTVTSHATTKESDSVGITIPYEINISDIAIDEGMLELSKSLMKVNLVKVDGMTENEVVVPTLMSSLSSSSLNTGASVVYQANDTHKNGSTTITSKYRLRAWITEGFDASNTDDTYQYKFRVNVNSNMDGANSNQSETKLLRTAIMNQGVVSSGDGLYMSTQTNDGTPTYYYHGATEENYVKFASKAGCGYNGQEVYMADTQNLIMNNITTESECLSTKVCDARDAVLNGQKLGVYIVGADAATCAYFGGTYTNEDATWADDAIDISWRVVRINEDGTIKMILDDFLNDVYFNKNNYTSYEYMYYSASNVEGGINKTVDDWYATTLEEDYGDNIALTNFCESAKVKDESYYTSGNATMEVSDNYTANFKCEEDGNGKQYVNAKAGLLTVDELLMAGVPLDTGSQTNNTHTYLQKSYGWWTMSAAGFGSTEAYAWFVSSSGCAFYSSAHGYGPFRPVISLNADTQVTGNGTSTSPWVVQ